MKKSVVTLVSSCLLAAVAGAEVRVSVEEAKGLAWLKYQCTAGERIRAFALDVAVDRGQITGISDFLVGPNSASAHGYGIFPAAFRDHVAATVTSGTSANWSASGYNPVASAADAPADTLGGLGTSGVTLEMGALRDPALSAAAPASSGTRCALQLSQSAMVTVAANASRGGVVASPDGNVVVPVFAGAAVGPLPEIDLLRFAFNLDPTQPDVRALSVGADGTAGLPGGARAGGLLRLEFLRRKAGTQPGITHTPRFGSAPDAWTDFTGTASVSPLTPENPTWERVVVDDPAPGQGTCFGRLKVVQTP
ncbi:MAG: hypothetical protein NTW21_11000 [Verrucomicrobia bacterium]|nr:hypothetical protein [Verrucomicrobiota bacterium]